MKEIMGRDGTRSMSEVVVTVGLDLGRTLGWCLVVDRDGEIGQVQWGRHKLKGDQRLAVHLGFRDFLENNVHRLLLDANVVAFEDVRFNRGFSYIPFQKAFLQTECYRRNIECLGVNVETLKKWSTGKGGVSKKKMIEAAAARVGVEPDELKDDEADAILVAHWAVLGVDG